MIDLVEDGKTLISFDADTMKWSADNAKLQGMLNDITETMLEQMSPADGHPVHVVVSAFADLFDMEIKGELPEQEEEGEVFY